MPFLQTHNHTVILQINYINCQGNLNIILFLNIFPDYYRPGVSGAVLQTGLCLNTELTDDLPQESLRGSYT